MGRCEENSHRVFRPNQKVKKPIMVSTAGQAIDKTVYIFVHVYINKQGHLFLYGSCFKCRCNPILGSCIFFFSIFTASRVGLPVNGGWQRIHATAW